MTLQDLGWNQFFQTNLPNDTTPARVMEEQRGMWQVQNEQAPAWVTLSAPFRRSTDLGGDHPAVGDWVGVRDGLIECVLPRRTRFSRQAAGQRTAEQMIAANVDTVFIVTSINRDLNLSRLERYLTSVWKSGATPVILLNKSDLVGDTSEALGKVAAIASGVAVLAVSAIEGAGLDPLADYLRPGQTVALVGSSGVGKSTLVNRLLGYDAQAVTSIREDDDRGRHTTTARRIIPLSGGGLLLDTPGMREFQLWEGSENIAETFPEIEELAASCRFRDCKHEAEPGCAVQQAIADGRIDSRRIANFRHLGKELQHSVVKQDAAARAEQTKKWRKLHKQVKEIYKTRDKFKP